MENLTRYIKTQAKEANVINFDYIFLPDIRIRPKHYKKYKKFTLRPIDGLEDRIKHKSISIIK
jgi:hypothetical protein